MKKITLLIFSVFYITFSNGQAVGGWGNCEFATVATMNAFDPSTNAYDCKKVFVQATNEHYHWDGTQWVLDNDYAENIYNTDGTLTANRTMTMDGKDLTFDGSTKDVFIESTGKVGIGTTSPSQDLDVNGVTLLRNGNSAFNFSKDQLQFGYNSSDTYRHTIKSRHNSGSPIGNSLDFYLWNQGTDLLTNVGTQHVMTLDGNNGGSLGIGTTSPDAKLDVEGGTVRFSDYGAGTNSGTATRLLAVDADGDVIETPLVTNTDAQTLSLATNTLSISGGNNVDLSGLADNLGNHTATTNLNMSTHDIDFTTGNINFGTSVRQMINLWSTSYGIGIQGGTQYYRTGAHFAWYKGGVHNNTGFNNGGGTTMMVLNSSGNLGIGTDSPDARLDVEGGTVRFSDYGTGVNIGASSYLLAVDADGDVIEEELTNASGTGAMDNIYSTDGTIQANRTVDLDGKDLTFKGTNDVFIESTGDVGIGTSSPSGQLHAINDENANGFLFESGNNLTGEKDVFTIQDKDVGGGGQDKSSVLKVYKSANINVGDLGTSLIETTYTGADPGDNKYWISGRKTDEGAPEWGINISDNEIWSKGGILLNASSVATGEYSGGDFIVESDGDVGIGTNSPAARLEVDGGTVRFSDYGAGTNTGTETQMLAVDTNGDVIEMNTVKSAKIFYPPAIAVTADAIDTDLTLDLHQQYITLFGSPAVNSTGAPAAIPTYGETELYYYVTDYDTDIFDNVTINANGVMEYDVKAVPSDNCSFINVVFVVK